MPGPQLRSIVGGALLLALVTATVLPGCVFSDPTVATSDATLSGRPAILRAPADPGAPPLTTAPAWHDGPLTLDRAIELALAGNPRIAAARHDTDVVMAQRDVTTGDALPKLGIVGTATNYLNDQRLIAPQRNLEAGVYSDQILFGGLALSVPLFTGGRLTRRIEAADLLSAAALHQLARTREEIVFNVSSIFYGILAAEHVVESLEFSQKALTEHLKRVNGLIEQQRAARVDRLRTEVRLANLDENFARVQNEVEVLKRTLATLLGSPADGGELNVAGALDPCRATVPSLDEGLADAFAQRSDYLAAKEALEAQAKRVDAARAGHSPDISLVGSYGGRWAVNPSAHPAGTSTSGDVGQVGLVLDLPIFDGGRISARVREETARLKAARERLREVELRIGLEVEASQLDIHAAGVRVAATEKSTEQGKESLRIEREKYDVGKGAIVNVLDAQSDLLDAQTNYYRALADLNVAQAAYRLAVGESPAKDIRQERNRN